MTFLLRGMSGQRERPTLVETITHRGDNHEDPACYTRGRRYCNSMYVAVDCEQVACKFGLKTVEQDGVLIDISSQQHGALLDTAAGLDLCRLL